MKKPSKFLLYGMGIWVAILLTIAAIQPKHTNFYDGEGNIIPFEAVQLLNKSQFVHLSKAQTDSLRKYYYLHN